MFRPIALLEDTTFLSIRHTKKYQINEGFAYIYTGKMPLAKIPVYYFDILFSQHPDDTELFNKELFLRAWVNESVANDRERIIRAMQEAASNTDILMDAAIQKLNSPTLSNSKSEKSLDYRKKMTQNVS